MISDTQPPRFLETPGTQRRPTLTGDGVGGLLDNPPPTLMAAISFWCRGSSSLADEGTQRPNMFGTFDDVLQNGKCTNKQQLDM